MDQQLLDIFVLSLKRKELIVDYFQVATFALFLYDYILTFHKEVQTIWFGSSWTYTKVLFMLTRYLPVIGLVFLLRNQLFSGLPVDSCGWVYGVSTWLIVVGIACAEAILALRTWAVWLHDFKVGVALLFLQVAVFVVNCFSASRFVNSLEFSNPPYPDYSGCFITRSTNILWINFLALTISQTVVFTLMSIRSYQEYQPGHMNALSQVIHRDSLVFYFYLLCMAYINLFVMLSLPTDFVSMLPPMQGIIHSIFTARIIINIRSLGNRIPGDTCLDLDDPECETQLHTMPIAFRHTVTTIDPERW